MSSTVNFVITYFSLWTCYGISFILLKHWVVFIIVFIIIIIVF